MPAHRLPPLLLGALAGALAACSSPPPQESAATATATATDAVAAAAAVEDARRERGDAPALAERDPAQLQAAAPPPAVQSKAEPAAMAAGAALQVAPSAPACCPPPIVEEQRETYEHLPSHAVQRVAEAPVSTFSVDVDTGSYAVVRRWLEQGRLPPQDAVRVEELVNYFDYGDAPPRDRGTPFGIHTEMAPTPWNARTHLLRIGLKGWLPATPAPSNLVFLVDVSGSMQDADKLPLVKQALSMLARQMTHQDRISLVVYAGASGVVLEPTPGDDTAAIESALTRLEAGGSTNGADGIRLAYAMAQRAFRPGANNRVLLATDGDFNVGTVNFEELVDLVEEKRRSGIALTTLGFGQGNYNDRLMERLADAGNGNYAYIDSLAEAHKVLVRQRESTLTTIARDVKVQVEFNPAVVSEYRLIGYENRALRREDFANDQVDAGEIGAGHTVTALYEVALVGEGGERVEPLRYGREAAPQGKGAELAFLRLRYKRPQDGMQAQSLLVEQPIARADTARSVERASRALRLSAAVAAFGQLLRGGAYTGDFQYTDVERLARAARGDDADGDERGFERLVAQARELSSQQGRLDMEE